MNDWDAELAEYDFELPSECIARRPLAERTASRLLHWGAQGFEHRGFRELPRLLLPGDLVVFNESKVLPARLYGLKQGGGARVEILLERPLEGDRWAALIRPARRLPEGSVVMLDGGLELRVGRTLRGASRVVQAPNLAAHAERHGHVPLPPYLGREDDASDRERYQTVYARESGSIAAPTAGLHFDDDLLAELDARGVDREHLTLHVGLGTFAPLDERAMREHELHEEYFRIPERTQHAIARARTRGGRVVAVGTTTCRALESWARAEDLVPAGDYHGETRLFLRPGDRFRIVDLLVTNFHLPRSSLLMLVSAFAGPRWREAYRLAIAEGYRFYSYGDANLIERRTS